MSLTASRSAPEIRGPQETIEELHHVPENGKAEIVQGRVVQMSPTGARPGRTAGRIFISLSHY